MIGKLSEELHNWRTGGVRVLDHGYLKLVDFMGTDESIVEAARMSTDKGFEGWEPHLHCKKCGRTSSELSGEAFANVSCVAGAIHDLEKRNGDAKLLDFLWRKRHSTPFEMCNLVVEIQAPIMVFREWFRHRTQSYAEMSARYVQMPDLHYVPELSRIQQQSKTNKQGSGDPLPEEQALQVISDFRREQDGVYEHYDALLEMGVAKEIARINTPVSRYSRARASANLLNWFRFLGLRMPSSAQFEIRAFANPLSDLIKLLWPRSHALFEEYNLHGLELSGGKVAVLAAKLGMSVEAFRAEYGN